MPPQDVSSSNDGTVSNISNSNEAQNDQPPPEQQPAQQNMWSFVKGLAFRILVIYFISSLFRGKSTPPTTETVDGSKYTPLPSRNLFSNGTSMDFFVYVTENELSPNFSDINQLIWSQKNIIYGDYYGGPNQDSTYELKTNIPASERVQNNGSIYLHVYFVRNGFLPYPKKGSLYSERFTLHKSKRLNMYKRKKFKKTHNLLTKESNVNQETIDQLVEQVQSAQLYSHWHPNLTISIVDDHTNWVRGQVPKPLDEFIDFDPQTGNYYPILYLNDYWNLLRDYQPVNETTKLLPLHLTFTPISMFKFQLYMAQMMRNKWSNAFGINMIEESEEEQDSVKEAFLETSPYLLALTVIVSLTHSVFEFLAFKNDIQFWNKRQNLEGLSVRSVFFNVFQSLIVLLYVLDNDTNTIVRISIGVGLLIELWKIKKVVDINVNTENKILGIFPRISFSDKGSYANSPTKEYDNLAFKYLSWALFPLLVGYCVYSLIYQEHKGWYSWILNMLYGFLLTFGFIAMTPQLFINYKLKSVAHLPWRMLTYKFLNTFIDDIFAFVIKMPLLYRLGCFRDDIIFLVYLYQRYKYRVDYKRQNEYGFSGDDLDRLNSDQPSTSSNPPPQSSIEASEETKKDQ